MILDITHVHPNLPFSIADLVLLHVEGKLALTCCWKVQDDVSGFSGPVRPQLGTCFFVRSISPFSQPPEYFPVLFCLLHTAQQLIGE